jgi:predicted dehydrogenase/nucleoside-diphosphate-sugar epimerase
MAVMEQRVTTRPVLRIAMVGAGKMAQSHVRSIGRLPGIARVTALVDPSAAALEAMKSLAPGAATFPTLDAMLAKEPPDVVHIVTPPSTHRDLARQALAAGCHIYVEKPFVETVAEATEILATARERGLKVAAGHQLLFESPARIALDLLPALGKLVHVESYFSFRPQRRNPDGRAPLRADLQLIDILPHPVYLLLHALERAGDEVPVLKSVEVGPAGTVHAIVTQGGLSANLTVTLEGRPVESYLRLVGTNGSIHADFVRSTVQRNIGPGFSGIDKLFAPYRQSRQLFFGTTRSMASRVLNRQRSYPGLVELFEAFYTSVLENTPSPISPSNILQTVTVCETVSAELSRFQERQRPAPLELTGSRVVLTGGTGFLGKAVAASLVAAGHRVTVLARRTVPSWEQVRGVEYQVAQLATKLDPAIFQGASAVIHAAAETAGAWEQHQKNSIDATENVLRAAAAGGVKRLVHVGSVMVLARGRKWEDDTPLEGDSRSQGPYMWGKLESERLATKLGAELGLDVKVMRPGALVDYANMDPPGRLGRRLGNLFVAVGSPGDRLGVVDVKFAADVLAWMVDHFEETPGVFNLFDPELLTKRELLARLRKSNPDLMVVWLPGLVLHPLSWGAIALQKILRPSKAATNVAKFFSVDKCSTDTSRMLAGRISRQ